jgi:hypothetical protein
MRPRKPSLMQPLQWPTETADTTCKTILFAAVPLGTNDCGASLRCQQTRLSGLFLVCLPCRI